MFPLFFGAAKDDEEDIVTAFDCGAEDYLVKPVSLIVLEKHIGAVLRRLSDGNPDSPHHSGKALL